jgi:hypothetical protein
MKKYENYFLIFFIGVFITVTNINAENISKIKRRGFENKMTALLFTPENQFTNLATNDTLYERSISLKD